MRALSRSPSPSASRGEHTCRLVEGGDAFRRVAVDFLAEGLRRGERLLYVADRCSDELAADLAPLGDVDRLLASRTLSIRSTTEAYRHDAGFDASRQVARYRKLIGAALADGHTGLRVAADATALVAGVQARRRFISYELAVDQLMTEAPMSALCGYDLATIGGAAGELCAVHPTDDAPPEVAPGFRLCFGPDGLALAGEIDVSNHELFAVTLEYAASCVDREVVIDAAHLVFIDVRGLVTLARLRDALVRCGRGLRVVNAPPMAPRCASILGLDRLLFAPHGRCS